MNEPSSGGNTSNSGDEVEGALAIDPTVTQSVSEYSPNLKYSLLPFYCESYARFHVLTIPYFLMVSSRVMMSYTFGAS